MPNMNELLDAVDGFLENQGYTAVKHNPQGIENGHDIRFAIAEIRQCPCSVEGVCVIVIAQALLNHMKKVDKWTESLARTVLWMAGFEPKDFDLRIPVES